MFKIVDLLGDTIFSSSVVVLSIALSKDSAARESECAIACKSNNVDLSFKLSRHYDNMSVSEIVIGSWKKKLNSKLLHRLPKKKKNVQKQTILTFFLILNFDSMTIVYTIRIYRAL